MTNKRITELTALDGDDVADNDVLAIVDVSDTTMAASGTTKKITVAELVTDSALTNKFWPNSTTALTGANLANGDKLAVVDVGSPDVAKYITADELAQGSQFSGRYMDISKVWIPAGSFIFTSGSPSTGTLGNAAFTANRQDVVLFDASTIESMAATWIHPANWATFDVYLWWSNAGAGSGDVFWQMSATSFADTETTDASNSTNTTIAAPAQYIAKRSKVNTVARTATPGEIGRINILRVASDAGDTLANDCGVIGVELVRAS